MITRKKLIEVALPLEAINKASAREKSIRHGHPSTLHLWWARRPLAAARAVIFAQMVDDPSSLPDLFPTEKAQEKERKRLFKIIEELVLWENTTNETVLERAREEIRQSWRRACADNADCPEAEKLFNREVLPAFHDPFAGGGALPLEAQRLGLEAYASDLNPVAVLINKAMIEIPPKFAGRPPVNPEARASGDLINREWKGAQGLAADVRRYGEWMSIEAEKRIGQLYPKIKITREMIRDRADLKSYEGRSLTVIAWLWTRTIRSPNPAFSHVEVPLASTFMLSTRANREVFVEPVVDGDGYGFVVRVGKPPDAAAAKAGTKLGRGANFRCVMSGTPIAADYIRNEGAMGRFGYRLMAAVVEGDRGRLYLDPTTEHEELARCADPEWQPEGETPTQLTGGGAQANRYGLTTWASLFTSRQLLALTTFSELLKELSQRVIQHAVANGLPDDGQPLRDGGHGATAYAEAVELYLALAVDKCSDYWSALCSWHVSGEKMRNTFSRQAIPMAWDYAEANPFSASSGNWMAMVDWVWKALSVVPAGTPGVATQADAQSQTTSDGKIVSTDPPYYDNIAYADLSDFFYVWMRRSLRATFPNLYATLSVPKAEELVALDYRHSDGRTGAEEFFLNGMTQAMHRFVEQTHPAFPVTIYYAFKQAETDGGGDTVSTGWETFLDAVIRAGLTLTGTWPIRTELGNRMRGLSSNALASSIVLVCRPRADSAQTVTRREFISHLQSSLPSALAKLQRGNIAPVDLAQAAIGPGMAVYTGYSRVLDAAGEPLTVREALALINQTLDEALVDQEGDFDADTRWALAWFEQSGFKEGEYGVAEVLSKAKVTSVQGLVDAGVVESKRGKVRLLPPDELPADWDPESDKRLTGWETVHHLVRALESGGESAAAVLLAKLGSEAETARELAYRLYALCERKKRAAEALSYNALVQSWSEIVRIAGEVRSTQPSQQTLFSED